MTRKEYLKELSGIRVEGELIKSIFFSLVSSAIVIAILYFFNYKNIDNFLSNYFLYIFLASISIALFSAIIRQVRAYNQFACMSGMMIGMTCGMIGGFIFGLYVGANNGMFIGSIFGIFIGIIIGIWLGKCCGIMGVMEGIMAGFMGGLMGAMTAVMMINDNLKLAVIISSIISWTILILLSYMVYNEKKEHKREKKEDYSLIIFISILLIILFSYIIIYGPKSSLFGG